MKKDEKKEQILKFKDTSEIKIEKRLIDKVIGQKEVVKIIEKAAAQKRHVLLLGEPGTGKSMLGKALAEILDKEDYVDILSYPNLKDENNPIIKITKAGDGRKIVDKEKSKSLSIGGNNFNWIIIILLLLSIGYSWWHSYKYYNQLDPLFTDVVYSSWIISDIIIVGFLFLTFMVFSIFSKKANMGLKKNSNPPKLVVDNSGKKIIFEDASGAHEGALLGDVLHDPFQTGGLGTPSHQRIVPGMIHKANGGVLFIDEIGTLKPEMQQELLTAIQEKEMSITGRSERSAGAMVRTTPCPTNFILVAAGNLDTLKNMHPALRSRIRGYGYEVYMKDTMKDTIKNRNKVYTFIAQEITKDKKIPHFTKDACDYIIFESKRRADKANKLTLRFRELGGIIRAAGDIAKTRKSNLTEKKDVVEALQKVKSIEEQLIKKYTENIKNYSVIKTEGSQIGRINGLSIIGSTPPYSGMVMPIEAQVVKGTKGDKFVATGKLGEIAKESITNISALIKKVFGIDLKNNYTVYIQFVQSYSGVEGDSASIAIAICVISSLYNLSIKQEVAITGSLSIRGEILPIGGVSAKIEGAIEGGMKKVIIPKSNFKDISISEENKKKIKIVPIERLDEILEHVFVKSDKLKKFISKFRKEIKK